MRNLILIMCTSFIIASDYHKEFKSVKKEALFDWVVRIIAFGIILKCSDWSNNKYSVFVFIVLAFIVNSIIEYRISKKITNNKEKTIEEKEIPITYEEKCNLRFIIKAVNSGMSSVMIFSAASLSVPVTKTMEGTTRGYIPVGISILVFLWFIKTTYYNYSGFYLDKKYAKSVFFRDITFDSVAYLICLTLSFFELSYEAYSWITIVGVLFTLPTIGTIRKMALRLRMIRENLDDDVYDYFLTKR